MITLRQCAPRVNKTLQCGCSGRVKRHSKGGSQKEGHAGRGQVAGGLRKSGWGEGPSHPDRRLSQSRAVGVAGTDAGGLPLKGGRRVLACIVWILGGWI